MMQSKGSSLADASGSSKPAKNKTRGLLFGFPQLLSLSEWSAKLLRLSRAEGAETSPGLVLIQIDGLSGRQLREAIAGRKMPFLGGLLQKKYYRVYPHYPGLPSSTPSVQGELFYGVKQIVPAFEFLDRESGKLFRMYNSEAVLEIERRLALQGQGLLKDGSSFSNIYSGGARESHFCATSLGWGKIWKDINPVNFVILALTHLPSLLRMLVLTLWEIVLGVVDFGRGILKGENFKKELKFIYLRALICVLLRELVTLGAKISMARGLPVIHLNLLGYDELAHNRGPSSRSAHWSLKGIDRAVERIYRKAGRSSRRSYDVWIYSDHGQEDTVSYEATRGRSIQDAVAEVFREFDAESGAWPFDKSGEQLQRARFLGPPFFDKIFRDALPAQSGSPGDKLVVTAMGPTGNIYLPRPMTKGEMRRFAKALVDRAQIPVLMAPEGPGRVSVWTGEGEFTLPRDAGKILGEDHPFLTQVTEDLIRVCHHPDAGDFTFMGFRPGHRPVTFPVENGSHAGPGPEETDGFAVLPGDIIPARRDLEYLTPADLRAAALRFLKRSPARESGPCSGVMTPENDRAVPDTIRIMTYNVHSCVGMDGKISPERIARVIGRHEPDIVALQEMDMGRTRTGAVDQPHLIARELAMIYHFHPSVVSDEERYGNAVLSRYPMELIRAGRLPGVIKNSKVEPRAAIWTAIDVAGTKINFFNTHLGLSPQERNRQARALLGPEWVAHPDCRGPVILCGDFNALPGSRLCLNIKGVLRDAQDALYNHRPQATWFSHYPVGRIDHVFIGPGIEVVRAEVSRTDMDKIASDHLPLIIDIKIRVDQA
jgi:endonuclease/exonuclease/phosphatase family metal-dependent hydrolase